MLRHSFFSKIKNKKGMAILEAIPIIIVMVLFVNFSLGFFGVIHSGILNSIASRNYAFETFRHRANLTYFRNTANASTDFSYAEVKSRVHGTTFEQNIDNPSINQFIPTTRTIDFFKFSKRAAEEKGLSRAEHSKIRTIASGRISEDVHGGVNPVWIKTMYGICIDSVCEK